MQYPSLDHGSRRRRSSVRVDEEVGEGLLPVDLDDGDPLAVCALELGVSGDVDLPELEPTGGPRR